MTLQGCLEECMEALDLFLNNHFSESLEKLKPRYDLSIMTVTVATGLKLFLRDPQMCSPIL